VIGYRTDRTYAGTPEDEDEADRAAFVTAATGRSKRAAAAAETVPNGVSIGGLTVDETFSVIGARFARAFTNKWSEPETLEDAGYTITLGENPAPRRGTQVFVEVEGTMLFQSYLLPNRWQIRQAAQQAMQRATLYLKKYYEPREVY
jgi:hypothetical protein